MSKRPRLTEIDSLDEVPAFATEHEEAEWWDTHGFSEKFFRDNPPEPDDPNLPPPRARTKPVAEAPYRGRGPGALSGPKARL